METVRKIQVDGSIDGLLEELKVATHADAAVFVHFGSHTDDVVVTDVVWSGQLANWGMMAGGEPPAGFDHDESDDAIGMRHEQWCLRAPLRRHFNAFCWLDDDVGQLAPWQRTNAYELLYNSNGFEHQYRAILVDHGIVTGWCGLFWRSLRNVGAVEVAVDERLDALRRAALAHSNADVRAHRILLSDCADELIGFSAGSESRFDESTLRELGRRARRRAMMGEERWFHGRWHVKHVPMSGDAGDAHLVLLEPLGPVVIDMRRALTTQQRKLAMLIAEGATNARAAQKLGVSPNTVKYHLKKIYPIVGVSNRVELASFMVGQGVVG